MKVFNSKAAANIEAQNDVNKRINAFLAKNKERLQELVGKLALTKDGKLNRQTELFLKHALLEEEKGFHLFFDARKSHVSICCNESNCRYIQGGNYIPVYGKGYAIIFMLDFYTGIVEYVSTELLKEDYSLEKSLNAISKVKKLEQEIEELKKEIV